MFDIIVKLWPGSCYVPLETLHRQRPALLSVNHLTYISGTCSLLPSTSAVKTSLMWANQSWPGSCYVPLETLHRQRPALLSVNHLTYITRCCHPRQQ